MLWINIVRCNSEIDCFTCTICEGFASALMDMDTGSAITGIRPHTIEMSDHVIKGYYHPENTENANEKNNALRLLTKRVLAVGRRSHELLSYQEQGFSELHSHLLGMGNAKFWLFIVMGWREMERTRQLQLMKPLDKWIERVSKLQFEELKTAGTKDEEFPHKFVGKISSDANPTLKDELRKKFESDAKERTGTIKVDAGEDGVVDDGSTVTITFNTGNDKTSATVPGEEKKITWTFTHEIVFSCECLATALGIDRSYTPSTESGREGAKDRLEEMFQAVVQLNKSWTEKLIVWNERKVEFNFIEGVRLGRIVRILGLQHQEVDRENGDSSLKKLTNQFYSAFELYDPYRGHSRSWELDPRGLFTPEFYPRRYKLRDTLYEQDLYVLQLLIKWELTRYKRAGVTYVEWSIGIKDVLRPHVMEHLCLSDNVRPSWTTQSDSGSNQCRESCLRDDRPYEGVTFKYLAAVPRTFICPDLEPFDMLHILKNNKDLAQNIHNTIINEVCAEEVDRKLALFNKQAIAYIKRPTNDHNSKERSPVCRLVGQLEKLKDFMKSSYEAYSENESRIPYSEAIVGLDWLSDELGRPYCLFASPPVTTAIKSIRHFLSEKFHVTDQLKYSPMPTVDGTRFKNRFGIRIHCGECVQVRSVGTAEHITYAARHCRFACEAIVKALTETQISEEEKEHCRIGHGVGIIEVKRFVEANNISNLDDSASIIESLQKLMETAPVFELNLTSNDSLLFKGKHNDCLPLSQVTRDIESGIKSSDKVKFLVCCDNEGIWPLPGAIYHADRSMFTGLAAEIGKHIFKGIISSEEVELLPKTGLERRFWVAKDRLEELSFKEFLGEKLKDNKNSIVIQVKDITPNKRRGGASLNSVGNPTANWFRNFSRCLPPSIYRNADVIVLRATTKHMLWDSVRRCSAQVGFRDYNRAPDCTRSPEAMAAESLIKHLDVQGTKHVVIIEGTQIELSRRALHLPIVSVCAKKPEGAANCPNSFKEYIEAHERRRAPEDVVACLYRSLQNDVYEGIETPGETHFLECSQSPYTPSLLDPDTIFDVHLKACFFQCTGKQWLESFVSNSQDDESLGSNISINVADIAEVLDPIHDAVKEDIQKWLIDSLAQGDKNVINYVADFLNEIKQKELEKIVCSDFINDLRLIGVHGTCPRDHGYRVQENFIRIKEDCKEIRTTQQATESSPRSRSLSSLISSGDAHGGSGMDNFTKETDEGNASNNPRYDLEGRKRKGPTTREMNKRAASSNEVLSSKKKQR